MIEIKPLTIEETALKEEMKSRCLNKGQYIDKKAEDKFKMLCHLEDFEIQYWELKDNWNKLKEWINIVQQNKYNKHLEPFISTDELDELLDILKEVE